MNTCWKYPPHRWCSVRMLTQWHPPLKPWYKWQGRQLRENGHLRARHWSKGHSVPLSRKTAAFYSVSDLWLKNMTHWSVMSSCGIKTFNIFNKDCHSELLNVAFVGCVRCFLLLNWNSWQLEVKCVLLLLAWYERCRLHAGKQSGKMHFRLFNESYSDKLDFFDDFKLFHNAS